MAFLDLFITSSIPVLKVLLVTGLGSYLALDRIGILGDDARKHLNNIIFFVFNPALVSSNLAKEITYESMVKMWFMPFNILITFVIGSILGLVIVRITKAPPHLQGLVIGCCAAGNLGNLLFIIIPTARKERTSTFGDADVCHENGMAYASLSLAIGAIYLWAYVYNIVRVSSSMFSRESSSSPSGGSWTEPLLSSSNSPQDRFENKPPVSVAAKMMKKLEILVEKMNLKRLFAPSTTAAIAGFVVGLVPQIRKLLIGDAAPLRVIQDTALFLGDGAIPAVTLIMGGNLIKGLKGSGIQKSVIIGVLAVRYVALPLTGIAVVKGALRFGLIHNDPLYLFVLLLQFSLPPAMNIGTITQLFGVGESECSVIMLWCYTLASLSLTLWSTVFLWLVS
ncbi:protein PIN-LIKES 1 isoform X2 [Sesamum indicum]|nr:protein PIN-LIKES 1 isoform X2 [Sesamum indicum]XP_011099976.1 protein PIN-LIKES 1 isoform X2 [Sesamum indicum]XP_020547711.1 protein PIN-LIKES 1 isoform X2 [Sesamum indicum]XP_020547712.1 protein PIN-LIKES 1 isoform X2 [Sesamum indicum]